MNEFAGPMFWIFGEIPEFPDRRRLEGVRSFVFWDRKRLEGVRKFWEWAEFAKYRDFPYIFPDLFGNFPIGQKNQVLF